MDLGLKDKVALVTASSRGLGFATALELAREGASVMICGRDEHSLQTAVRRIRETVGDGAKITETRANVEIPGDVENLIEQTRSHFGGIDILVTNAGGPPGGTMETTDILAWKKGLELTLLSAVQLIRLSLPYLRKSDTPSILTITSFSVKQPIPGLLLSNVIRPAVVGLTKSLSQELGPEGIRVNSILPGWTATERVEEIMRYRAETNSTTIAEEKAKVISGIPLGHMARPDEFGKVAAFLVSPCASYVNGVMLQVDGGEYRGLL